MFSGIVYRIFHKSEPIVNYYHSAQGIPLPSSQHSATNLLSDRLALSAKFWYDYNRFLRKGVMV